MDVRMPDGTLIKNVPEGTTKEDLLERYSAYNGEFGAKDPESAKPPLMDSVKAGIRGAAELGAPLEVAGRMLSGMAGMAGGALGGSAAAVMTGADRPDMAGEIRRSMSEGAEAMTPPAFTKAAPVIEEAISPAFEAIREGMGRGAEMTVRFPKTQEELESQAAQARMSPQEYLEMLHGRADVARTVGEYGFDAPAATAPFSIARSLARPRPRPAVPHETPKPSEPSVSNAFNPRSIVERAITETERPYKEPIGRAYEVPEVAPEIKPSETMEGTREAINRFREAGEVRAEPITEQERTAEAIRARRSEMGAVGDLGDATNRSRPSVLDEIRDVEDQIRDAKNREEKDVVRFLEKELANLKHELAQTDYIVERKSDPFRGPGKKERGAIGFDPEVTGELVPLLKRAFEKLKSLYPRFSEIADIHVMGPQQWKDRLEQGVKNKEIHPSDQTRFLNGDVPLYYSPADEIIFVNPKADLFKSRGWSNEIAGIFAHELTHALQDIRGRFAKWEKDKEAMKTWETNPHNRPWEIEAGRSEETVKRRLYSGPGKRQRGSFTPFASTIEARSRTQFEREENLPAGGGLSIPDLKAPLEQRAAETITIGKDMNLAVGKEFLVGLSNDIGAFFTKYVMNPEQLSKFAGTKNPLIKAVIDRIADKKRHWSSVREDMIKGADFIRTGGVTALRYVKRASQQGFNGIVERLGKNDQESFFRARLEFDQSPVLIEAGLQWPTREMLAERGYSNKVIDAYMLEAQYMDSAYDLINWARQLTDKDPIIRIPGYLPHTYKGHMGIKVFRRIRNGNGTVEDIPVGFTKTSGGIKDVNRAAEQLMADLRETLQKEGQPDIELRYEVDRTDRPGSTPDVIDALEMVGKIFTNSDKPLIRLVKRVLDRRMQSLEQQFLQSALKRDGVAGWIGHTGVTQKNLDQLIRARSQYMENAIKFAESQDILTSTTESITPETWKDLTRRMPNTADFISKLVDVARDRFPLSEIDKTALNLFAEWTGDRFTYRAPLMGLNKLRGFFSAKDLAWSVSYHTGNAIQPEMLGGTALMREYSRIGLGDPLTAMMLMEKEFIAPRLENVRAIEWAGKGKVLTPKLMEEIDFMYGKSSRFTKDVARDVYTGRRASELNEAVGRLKTFLMGLEYYRSAGFTEMQARSAAAKFVDDVMVDYTTTGQPLWLSSNPMGQLGGRLVAPYAAFRHSFWGQTALAVQAMKNNPGLRHKMLPFIQLQLATATFGGLRGMAFMAEATLLATAFNTWWEYQYNEPGPLPTPQKWFLEKGLGDFMLFGALSTLTKQISGMPAGIDVGQTVTAPTVMEAVTPRSIEGTVEALAETGTIFKIIFGNAADSEKLRLLKATTPNFTHGWWEAAYMQDEEVSPDDRNRMRGNVSRTLYDWRTRVITGKRSLNEQRQLFAKNIVQTEERQVKERKADITELAADFMSKEGYLDPDLVEKALDEGYTYKEFKERVNDLMEQRQKSRLGNMTGTKKRTRTRERIRDRVDELLQDTDY